MKKSAFYLILVAFFISGCSGAQSEVKKNWRNSENTLNIVDLTSREHHLADAGARLQDFLEDKMDGTGFVLAGKNARYQLKYKVLEYEEGSRFARLATFGVSDSAKGRLRIKVALFKEDSLVGGWIVDSWVKGGLTGGSAKKLFTKAAEEITMNLKGSF